MAFGYGVYFCERDRNRVVRWDPDSGRTEVVAGESPAGERDQLLKDPYALAWEGGGKLLITDKLHHRIVRLKSGRLEEVTLKDKDGHRNRRPESTRGYQPMPPLSPSGLWAERGGSLLATYYNDCTAYRIHPDGRLELVLGKNPSRPYFITERRESVPPPEVADTPLAKPAGIAARPDGTIFLIERGFQTVREFHPKKGYSSPFPLAKQEDCRGMSRAPESASLSEYCPVYPGSITVDSRGMLFVTEIHHRCVLEVDLENRRIRRVMESAKPPRENLGGISGLGFGPDGTAWVMDTPAGVIQGYQTDPARPWRPIGKSLKEVGGEPLRLNTGGAGVVAGA